MELTGIAICASLLMAAATVCAFIYAVKKDYFRNIEDTKYQVFWSDLEEPTKEKPNVRGSQKRS
ncbi:MAG TPA: hypothetical protein VLW65_25290 [Bryobacteraceae bacterium]|nr:hypothetical protein [Bryobacteraceae bacterium]